MSAETRTPLDEIWPVAARIAEAIRPCCLAVEIAGSIRRRQEFIGDIEIVAIPIRPKTLFGEEILDQPSLLDDFLNERGVQFTKRGPKYQQFRYGRHTVDLFLASFATWGSVFTIRTGSWEFSRWLVTSQAAGGAKPDAVAFQDGRLLANGRLLVTHDEDDVFAAVGLEWISPILRTGPIDNPARIEPVWNYEEIRK